MSNFDESMFEEVVEEVSPKPPSRPPKNRNFMVAVGLLGVVFLLALVALIAYAVLFLPGQRTARLEQAALINAQNTATAMAATQRAALEFAMLNPSETPLPSPTAVVVFAIEIPTPEATETPAVGVILAAEMGARTQTVAALLTQAAAGGAIVGDPAATATALPQAGFMDDLGALELAGLSALLISVIFWVRRLRQAANS